MEGWANEKEGAEGPGLGLFGAAGEDAVATVGNANEEGFTDSAGLEMDGVEGNENAGTAVEDWPVEAEGTGGAANEDGVGSFVSTVGAGVSDLTAAGGALTGGTEGVGVPTGAADFF